MKSMKRKYKICETSSVRSGKHRQTFFLEWFKLAGGGGGGGGGAVCRVALGGDRRRY